MVGGARRLAGTRRKARTPKALPVPVDAAVGERLWCLAVPFRVAAPGATWDASRKVHVYVGESLPEELQAFRSEQFSWQRWLEDDANGTPGPAAPPATAMEPRQLQIDGAAAILAGSNSTYDGHPARGMLITDDVGTGKTLTAWLGILAVAAQRKVGTVLVLVDRPKQITVPHWRRTIRGAGTADLRVLVCTPDELPHLLDAGRSRWCFDLVVADEAHLYRNLDTARVRRFRTVTRFSTPHGKAPFVLYLTATPGNHPAEMTYLAPLLAQVHGEPPSRWADFGGRLLEAGLPLAKSYGSWTWNDRARAEPAVQADATATMRSWLTGMEPPLALYRSAPWGPAPLELMPTDLSADERRAYGTAWAQFRRAIEALAADREVRAHPARAASVGRAAVLRLRQKASMIRAATTADWAVAVTRAGRQAVVSCEFVGAAADPISLAVESAGIPVARVYAGRAAGRDLEQERLRFQTGAAPVVVFTPTTSLSLQAGELLADGGHAISAPREAVMHNVRYSGLQGRQILGRSHRDHQVCPWWIAYAENTVEETIAQIMLGRFKSTADSAGADSAALVQIAAALGISWLPVAALRGSEAHEGG